MFKRLIGIIFVTLLLLAVTASFMKPSQAATQTYSVYNDSLASGWVDWSWSSTNKITDTTHIYSGTKDVSWKPTAKWAGVYLHTDSGFSTNGYTELTFALWATKANQQIGVQLYDNQNKEIGTTFVNLSSYGGNPVNGQYKVYKIPLADLGGTNKTINGLHIQDITGVATNQFYLDAIAFNGETTAPTSTPTPTTVPTVVPTVTVAPTQQPTATPTPTKTPTPTPTTMPTPTGVVTPTPTVAPTTQLNLYKDTLGTGWESWSWDSNINFASTNPIFEGTKAITYTASALWSGLDFHNPLGINTSGYTTIHFALNAGQANSAYAVYMTDSTGAQLTAPLALTSLGGNPLLGQWKIYDVPLATLNAVNKTITGFIVHDISGKANSVVNVDDVALTKGTTATPTPTITPTPTVTPTPTTQPTATPTPTVKPTATPTPTVQPTATPTATVVPTATPTSTPTTVPTVTPTTTPIPTVTPPASNSLIANNSVETAGANNQPQSWFTNTWGTNTPTFSYLNTGHTGTHSVKTEITSYTSGDAKWYAQSVSASENKTYTFADYYQSNVSTRVLVEFLKSDGTYEYQELETAPAATDWANYQTSFTTPAGTASFIVLHVLSAVGYLTVDDYDLQASTVATTGFNRGIVTITWDDGVESQYTGAFPVFQKYGLVGTFYLISSFLNTDFYMTTSEASAIQAAGNELGSHTVDHLDLTTVTPEQLDTELRQSQTDLRNMFGTSFTNFATPFGAYNDAVLNAIPTYYGSHRSVDRGFNSPENLNINNIKIQQIDADTTLADVTAWVQEAKDTKTWLVLMYHQVDNPSDFLSVSSSDLDQQFSVLKNSGLPVLTMQQALDEVVPQINN